MRHKQTSARMAGLYNFGIFILLWLLFSRIMWLTYTFSNNILCVCVCVYILTVEDYDHKYTPNSNGQLFLFLILFIERVAWMILLYHICDMSFSPIVTVTVIVYILLHFYFLFFLFWNGVRIRISGYLLRTTNKGKKLFLFDGRFPHYMDIYIYIYQIGRFRGFELISF